MSNWHREVTVDSANGDTIVGHDGSWPVMVLCIGNQMPGSGVEGLNTTVVLDSGAFTALSNSGTFELFGNKDRSVLSQVEYQV
jgi:hypothetical protein